MRNPALHITRRHFFGDCGVGLGKIALASLLTGAIPGRAGANPLAPKKPHFAAKAKRVIHLFMAGAPSHLDLFDSKPALAKLEGKPLPPSVIGGQRSVTNQLGLQSHPWSAGQQPILRVARQQFGRRM